MIFVLFLASSTHSPSLLLFPHSTAFEIILPSLLLPTSVYPLLQVSRLPALSADDISVSLSFEINGFVLSPPCVTFLPNTLFFFTFFFPISLRIQINSTLFLPHWQLSRMTAECGITKYLAYLLVKKLKCMFPVKMTFFPCLDSIGEGRCHSVK